MPKILTPNDPGGRDAGDFPGYALSAGAIGPYTIPGRLPLFVHRSVSALAQPILRSEAVDETKPLWVDTSKHNGHANVRIMMENGVWGIFPRGGISWGYIDPQVAETMRQARELEMYYASYHVIYTDQPAFDQWVNWRNAQEYPDPDRPFPRAIDLEVQRGDSLDSKLATVEEMSELVEAHDGIPPLFYTRYLIANDWLRKASTEWLNDHYWWLAQYLFDRTREHPGPPTLPNRVKREQVLFQQTADKIATFPGATQNCCLDRNRWQLGNHLQMIEFIRINFGGGPITPPPTLEEQVAILWEAHPELHP